MKLRNIGLFITSTLILVIAAGYVYKNAEAFKKILDISFLQLGVFFFLQIISITVNALMLLPLLGVFGIRLAFLESFWISVINIFFNYLFIKGGAVAKGWVLKRVYRFSYTEYIAASAAIILITVMTAGLLGIFCLLFLYLEQGNFNRYLFFIFMTVCIVIFVLIKPSKRWDLNKEYKNVILRKLYRVLSSWKTLAKSKGVVGIVSILTVFNFAAYALRIKYGFHILYGGMSFLKCMIISVVGVVSNFFALTPGSIGVREFLMGTTYKMINGDMLQAVVVVAMDRAAAIILIFILGIISCFYFLVKDTRLKQQHKERGEVNA